MPGETREEAGAGIQPQGLLPQEGKRLDVEGLLGAVVPLDEH